MDTDEIPSIDDPTEAAWVSAERDRVTRYLSDQKVQHGGVSLEPRWYLSPYIALWAVRSKRNPESVGWWAISGDLPTDYITRTTEQKDADVLRSFARCWKAKAEEMMKGIRSAEYHIGPAGREKQFAAMLLPRAEMLNQFADEMENSGAEE